MHFETQATHCGVEGVSYAVSRQAFQPSNENKPEQDSSEMSDEEIDANLEDTFPASDPPSWTLGLDPEHRSKTSDGESPAE